MADRLSGGPTPRVSIIIAARNEERRIGQCLSSLLAQSFAPLEVIVVDDGSRDDTAGEAGKFPGVRVMRQRPKGKATAINAAAGIARGEVLFFLDADMYFEREYIQVMAAPILAGRCVGTAHATELVANPKGTWSRCFQVRSGLPPDRRVVLTRTQLAQGSIIYRAVRKQAFLEAGGFDEIGFMDDQTLYPKLKVRAVWIPEAVCWHYNFESLGEVFGSGKWAARSIRHFHGRASLWGYLPILSLWRGALQAWRHRVPALLPFVTVYEAGIFTGLLLGA